MFLMEKSLFHTNNVNDLMGAIILTQGHLGNFKVTGKKSTKLVFGPYLSYGERLNVFTLHTVSKKIADDMSWFHNFVPWSLSQVQWHFKEKYEICVQSISFLWKNIGRSYFTLLESCTNDQRSKSRHILSSLFVKL